MTIVYLPLVAMKWIGVPLFLMALLSGIAGSGPDEHVNYDNEPDRWWFNGLRWFSWPLFLFWFFWIFTRGLVN